MTVGFAWALEMYLSGAWVDVTADVRSSAPATISRGIDGSGITDRVAKVGTLSFVLDNSAGNSASTLGYYSPDNASVRTGFRLGTKTRLKIFEELYYTDGEAITDEAGLSITDESDNVLVTDGGWSRYDTGHCKYCGKISDITPIAGALKERHVSVLCVDYMNELLVHNTNKIDVQINQTGDQLHGTIVANLPTAPLATSYAAGLDTFAYSLHDIQDERTSAMNAVQRVDQSDLSFTFVTADAVYGEVLNWQNRNTRAALSPVATFANTMRDLIVNQKADTIYNNIKATGYPVYIGTTDEVLWTSRKEIPLPTGGDWSIVPSVRFSDPSGGSRVALSPGTGIVPDSVAGDYRMSSVAGDNGTDLTASLGRVIIWGGNTAYIQLSQNSGVMGYVNLLQLRGRIIRTYDPLEVISIDATSQATYGDRVLSIAFPYLDDATALSAFSVALLALLKDPHSTVDSLEFIASSNATLMSAAMACDVGVRITFSETVTGFSAKDFFVNSYDLTIEPNKLICKLGNLVPA